VGDHVDACYGGGEGIVIDICDGALSVLLDDGRTVTTHSIKVAAADTSQTTTAHVRH
jgi:hypothetical protein